MSILTFLLGLFGYRKRKHTVSDIRSVSISCSHMCYTYGYSFWLHLKEDKWLFHAHCFTDDYERETEFENREVSEEAVRELFEIIKQNSLIEYVEKYRKPKSLPFHICDETIYGFCLTFADEIMYSTADRQTALEKFFYRLAQNTD